MNDSVPPSEQPGPAPSGPGPSGPTSSASSSTSPPPDGGPRVTRDEVQDLGRLRRSVTDRRIAGVAGGIARHLDIDPVLVRVALVVAVFFGGAGLLLYVGAWVLVPEEGSTEEPLGLDPRNRGYALMGVGALAFLAAIGDWAGAFWFPWPVVLVALAIVWWVRRDQGQRQYQNQGQDQGQYQGRQAPYGGPPPGWPEQAPTTPRQAGAVQPAPVGSPAVSAHVAPPGAPYVPPVPTYDYARPPIPPRRENPRKRGPLLFWFTLALIALAEGVLGVVDLAGTYVVPSAYPALALGITAAMLVLGSFWGRAGGLVLVGLLAAGATAVVTVADHADLGPETRVVHRPAQASSVLDVYDMTRGETVVDLSGVDDVEELDGRDLRVNGGAGRLEVIVPEGMDVSVGASVGVGSVSVFGDNSGGLGVKQSGFVDGGDEVPDMSIVIDLGVGEVVVLEQ